MDERLDERLGPMRQESARRILLMLKKSLYMTWPPLKPAQRGVLRSSHVSVPAVPALGFGGVHRTSPTPAREPLELALEQGPGNGAGSGPVANRGGKADLAKTAQYRPNSALARLLRSAGEQKFSLFAGAFWDAAILRQSRREPPAYLAEITPQ